MHQVNHRALQMEKVLSGLSQSALRMLERSVEETLFLGKSVPNADLMLQTIRRLLGKVTSLPEIKLSLEMPLRRAILSPLQPFLVPVPLREHMAGRIDTSAIDRLWTYMSEELLAEELPEALSAIKEFCDEQDLPQTHDTVKNAVSSAAEGLRKRLTVAAQKALEATDNDSQARMKLRRKVGGYINFDYFKDALLILERAPAWEKLMAQTAPFSEDVLSMASGDNLSALRAHIEEHPQEAIYLAALSYLRLDEAPVELIRMAQALASTERLRDTIETPYAAFVEFALSAFEQSITVVEGWQKDDGSVVGLPEAANACLIHFEELGELDGFIECEQWFERSKTIKDRLCSMLKEEIRTLPSLLEEAIASETSMAADSGKAYDDDRAEQIQRAYHKCLRGLKLAKLASQYAEILGLNELHSTTHEHVERFIDRNSQKLLVPAKKEENQTETEPNCGETTRRLSRLISMSEISLEPEDTANLIRRQKTYLLNAA